MMNSSQQQNSTLGEWIRFGILVLVLLGTVLVVALSRPFVANRVVPAFLGSQENHQVSLPIMEDSSEVAPAEETGESDAVEGDVSGEATEGGEETAVDETAPAAEETTDGISNDEAAADPEPASTLTHTIQPGESLFVLAQRYNVTINQIVEANNITNPNRIAVGDELVIPQP